MYNLSKDSIKILKSITKNSKEILKNANPSKKVYEVGDFIGNNSFLILRNQFKLFDNQYSKIEYEHCKSNVEILKYIEQAEICTHILEKHKFTKITDSAGNITFFNSHYIRFIKLNLQYTHFKLLHDLLYVFNNDKVICICYGVRMSNYDLDNFEHDLNIEDYIKEYSELMQEQKENNEILSSQFYKIINNCIIDEFKKIISCNKDLDINLLANGELSLKGNSIYLRNSILCYINATTGVYKSVYRKTFNKFVKENKIIDLLNAAKEEIKKDLEKIEKANDSKHILEECKSLIIDYMELIHEDIKSIELLDSNIRANDWELKYCLRIEFKVGNLREHYFIKMLDDNKSISFDDLTNEYHRVANNPEELLSIFKQYTNDLINEELINYNKSLILKELKQELLKNDKKLVIRKLVNNKYEYYTTDLLFYNSLYRKKEKTISKLNEFDTIEILNCPKSEFFIIDDNIVPDAKMLKSYEYFNYNDYMNTKLKEKNDNVLLNEFTNYKNLDSIHLEYVKNTIEPVLDYIIDSGEENEIKLKHELENNFYIGDLFKIEFNINNEMVEFESLIVTKIKSKLDNNKILSSYSINIKEVVFNSIYNKIYNSCTRPYEKYF